MKTKELIFASIIIGYILAVFSIVVIEREIQNQNYEPQPMQMVELFGNGSTRNYEVENSFEPNILSSIAGALGQFAFALPFVVFTGLGIWGVPIAMIQGNFVVSSDVSYSALVFWISSIISIPVTAVLSKGIPIWRRIPYIYLIAVLIGGTLMLLSSNFGR